MTDTAHTPTPARRRPRHADAAPTLHGRSWLDTASRRPLTGAQLYAAAQRLADAWHATIWEPR